MSGQHVGGVSCFSDLQGPDVEQPSNPPGDQSQSTGAEGEGLHCCDVAVKYKHTLCTLPL